MAEIIDRINHEFRETLEKMGDGSNSPLAIMELVNKRFLAEGCYLRGKTPEEPKPFPIFIKPHFITRERINYVAHASNVIMDVLEKVTDLYFTNPEMRPLFQLKPAEEEVVAIEPGFQRKVKITRNDAFLTGEYFKMIEFNTDSPGGPKYSDVQGDIIGNTPVMWELRKKYRLHTDQFMPTCLRVLVDSYREFGGKKPRPFIALVAGEGSATLPEFKLIARWMRETQGFESEYSDPRWLTYDGKSLRTRAGQEVDIIYRRGWLPDWTDHMAEIQPLLQAYRDRKVCVVNPPRSILASNKSLIGVIQDPEIQKLFSDEEKRVIRENVPWTRLVQEGHTTDNEGREVDLYPYVRANRETPGAQTPSTNSAARMSALAPLRSKVPGNSGSKKPPNTVSWFRITSPIPEESLPECKPELGWYPKKVNVNFFRL